MAGPWGPSTRQKKEDGESNIGILVRFPKERRVTASRRSMEDCLGEAPIHKAAKVGNLECLALLVVGDAKIDLRNNSGQTAAELALAYGFLECAKFLTGIQQSRALKRRGQPGCAPGDQCRSPREDPAARKGESDTSRSVSRKRRRADGV
ncbi:PREDICTED: ankyrin repeat domain-containing protein 37 [Charadrius vociferus]|uniref:ankyrin repeat domain-containing protein 37 n=1 Tax=Charadrius vociferus TaxID=50402 RepID=UPI0005219025|nr:PREDICTED: ankyrin repeat domain-containing protein 37 [Charadrius vociferus]